MSDISNLYNSYIKGASICTDTRQITKGCIFFALKGENFNGNTFAATAIEKGAQFAVIDEPVTTHDSRYILVNDVLSCLQDLARHHRKQLTIPFIGITGSNGKTTTKELLGRVLSKKYKTNYTKGNLNNHIGVPLTILSISSSDEMAVIEMGANHQKEIELLCSIAIPNYVLITNVGKAHLEGFGGFEGVKKGKGEMYTHAKNNDALVFINNDSIDLNKMLGGYDKIFSYGTSTNCNIVATAFQSQQYVGVNWNVQGELKIHQTVSSLTGIYNFENIVAAIAIGTYFHVSPELINTAIAEYIPDNNRSQEIKIDGMHIILDSYNANPTSMHLAITNFDTHFKGKRAIFLGEMLELGTESKTEHRKLIDFIKQCSFDVVVLVGELFREAGNNDNLIFVDTTDEASQLISKMGLANFNILIKGSRGSKMEKVLESIRSNS